MAKFREHILPSEARQIKGSVSTTFFTTVFVSEAHLRHYVKAYIRHYNAERPHQGIGNVPVGPWKAGTGEIVCDESLNGLLKSFRRVA